MDWLLNLLDYPLGWLLALPRDVAIVIVAAGTSLLLTLVRKATTNQDQLRRTRGDLRRLKQLVRQARRAKDKATVKRLKATQATVNGIRLKAEGKPLLVSIFPIILLAVWAVERLDYLPPRLGEPLTVRAYYPVSSVGQLTHLVPPPSLTLRASPIQLVELDPEGQQNGLASWVLEPATASSTELLVRHQGATVRHPVLVGRRIYAPPVANHEGGKILATEAVLRRAKFLGVVPGIAAIGFPPWLVAYLLIVIPLVPILRRALRVY
jgi:type II secretory pathway pseudopilin PulG